MKLLKNIHKPIFWILGLGLVLRLYQYTAESIWLDESISIFIAQQPLVEVATFIDPTPPLFYILLHFWSFISIGEAWLKLLTIMLSLGSIYMTYLVATKMHTKKTGLIAALLVALSPISIFYAQELRTYSLLFFVTTALMYFYLTYKKSTKHKIGYYLFFIATVYTHVFGIFVLLAIQTHKLITEKKKFFFDKQWFISHGILTLLSIPWLYKMYIIIKLGEAGWIQLPKLVDVGVVYVQVLSGMSFFSIVSHILVIIATIVLLYSMSKTKKNTMTYLWIIFPIIIPYVLSFIIKPIFYPRYALLVSIPIFILLANGLSKIRFQKTLITTVCVLLLSITILQACSIEKDPWEQIDVNERPIGFIAYYEAFPYIYLHEPECFKQNSIDAVYVCAAQKDIYAIQVDYPPEKEIKTYVLSKYQLTESDTALYNLYVPINASLKKEYPTNTNVGIFQNYARSQPIFVVQP